MKFGFTFVAIARVDRAWAPRVVAPIVDADE
jgi:hypothetical protein